MLSRLHGASVRFRFLLLTLAVGVIVAGILRLPQMHVDVLPETSPTVVEVQTEALGLSAPEVEALVTVPLEKNLLEGVLNVTNVTSNSIPGLSSIALHFAPGTNLYQARQLVQERLTAAFVLPNVSKPPVMLQPVSSTSNVMIVGLSSSRLSQIDLSVLARWTIVPRLLGVAGVANVSTFGQADRQLQVRVKPSVLAAHHISLAQVIKSAGNSQLVSPLSFLAGSTPGTGGFLESPNQRLTIRHILPFGTPANLAQVPVTDAHGKPVLLGDLAKVVQGHQPLVGDALVGQGSGLLLVISKLPSASVPAVTAGVQQALAGLRTGLPHVRFNTSLFRPASYLATATSNIELGMIAAGLLALLALVLLLLNLRAAAISAITIVLSLVAAIAVLQALGYSLNVLVLLGLVLALGLVVDDAVRAACAVIAEQADDGQETAARPIVAVAVTAFRDFTGPLAAASVAALVCVAPLFFATGLTAAFLRPAVTAFSLAVLASMLVALTVGPAMTAVFFSVRRGSRRGDALARRIGARCTTVLRGVLGVRAWALLLACLAGLAALLVAVPRLHPRPPAFQDRDLVISWSGAPGMSLSELTSVTSRTDKALLAVPGVRDVGASLGRAVTSDQLVNTNAGQIWVAMRPDADYGRTLASIRSIVDGTPGMRATVSTYEHHSLHGALAGPPREVVVRVYGPSPARLPALAGQVRSLMSGVRGLGPAHVQLPADQPEINIEVNLLRAKLHGLTPGEVRREAATLLLGLTVGNFFQSEKVFDVTVQAQPSVRNNLTSIRNMVIDAGNGGHVRLRDVARISVAPEPADIKHQAMSPYLDVIAPVSGASSAKAAEAVIASRLASMRFPLEYRAEIVGTSTGGTSRSLFVSYLIAALLALLLIAQATLGSWRIAGLVLAALAAPAGAAALVAYVVGVTSLSAAAGVIGVLVLALRQSVAMAAGIRRRHASDGNGLSREIVLTAAAGGAAPLITSAVVTAYLLVPFIVLGDRPGTELVHGAAVVIVCGLAVATAVNLLLLPAAYLALGPAAARSEAEGDEDEARELALAGPAAGPET
jgi:Cu/Ag efflux pump CusA